MRRRTAALAVVATAALLSAGCGGTRDSTATGPATAVGAGSSSATGTVSARSRAVKFAECMRANGVSAFPDPDATGALTIDAVANGSSLDTDSPAFEHALDACRDLEPAGFTGHTRNADEQVGALRFARCIRDHGVPDFPDPAPDAPMIDTRRIPSANRSGGMDILHAAMQQCHDLAASAGVTGAR